MNVDVDKSLDSLAKTKTSNKWYGKGVIGLIVMVFLLAVSNFGTSIAAAKLSKDLDVDAETGFATVKGGTAIMKTSEALVVEDDINPGDLFEEELNIRQVNQAKTRLTFI